MDLQKELDKLELHFYEDSPMSSDAGVNKEDVLELLTKVYNQAIEDASNSAEAMEIGNEAFGEYQSLYIVDPESILKLKIKQAS